MELDTQQVERNNRLPRSDDRGRLLPISPWMLSGFHVIAQRRLKQAFRALRVAHAARAEGARDEALVVYLNHPSWWDPLVGFVLSKRLFGERHFYAPMDAEALKRYRIFKRLGMFPVQVRTPQGAAQFLRAGQTVLQGGHILAVTPQGRFTDARERPVRLRQGLASLLAHRQKLGQSTTVLPIALEYTFWDQRLPEALANCGHAMRFAGEQTRPSRAAVQAELEGALGRTQDELASLAQGRDPDTFSAAIEGTSGSSGFYGLLEGLRAAFRGGALKGDHTVGNREARHEEAVHNFWPTVSATDEAASPNRD